MMGRIGIGKTSVVSVVGLGADARSDSPASAETKGWQVALVRCCPAGRRARSRRAATLTSAPGAPGRSMSDRTWPRHRGHGHRGYCDGCCELAYVRKERANVDLADDDNQAHSTSVRRHLVGTALSPWISDRRSSEPSFSPPSACSGSTPGLSIAPTDSTSTAGCGDTGRCHRTARNAASPTFRRPAIGIALKWRA